MTIAGRTIQFVLPVKSAGRFLIVSCGAVRIGLPAAHVRGVLRPEEAGNSTTMVTALSSIYRLIDLSRRLEQPPGGDTPDTRVILYGTLDVQFAFRVDHVTGMVDIESRQIRPLPAHFVGIERHWFTGVYLSQNDMVLLAHLNWLLHDATQDSPIEWGGQQEMAGVEVFELEVAREEDDAPWATF